MPLGLFVKKLQSKVGLAGYAYFVVEAKNKTTEIFRIANLTAIYLLGIISFQTFSTRQAYFHGVIDSCKSDPWEIPNVLK